MIKTVAVGTDGSDTAGTAVSAALELAERYGASLVVLSACDGGSGAVAAPRLSPSAHPEWASNAAERILAVAEESAAERGIECSTAMAGRSRRGARAPRRQQR
jgi:nucleotide-binding universal stress UspA family protein